MSSRSYQSRWFVRSSFFHDQPQSYYSTSSHDPDVAEQLSKIAIVSYLPVLCWFEKLVLIIDYFQIFSLIWIAAQPWPWPYLWTQYTRPLLYINLDFFSLTDDGALAGQTNNLKISKWGQMSGYCNYALYYSIAAAGLFLWSFFFKEKRDSYGEIKFHYRSFYLGLGLFLSYVFYLPCALAVFRLYYCEDGKLSADPDVECLSSEHTMYLAITTILSAPFLLGLPYAFILYTRSNVVYKNPVDHEKRIQLWEIQYMLGMDDYWMDAQIWLLAPFRLFGVYFQAHMLLLKLLLLIFFIFVRSNLVFQSGLMLSAIICFGAYYTFYKYPFRCFSTNAVLASCLAMHIFNLTFGFVDSTGQESAVTVGSVQFLILSSFNLICFVFIVAIFIFTVAIPDVLDWPSLRTMDRIYCNADLAVKVAEWVETIRESKLVHMDFMLSPVEIADINALEECIRRLKNCWATAKTYGSIFETILEESLEQCLWAHSNKLPNALRKYNYWDETYQQVAEQSTLKDHFNQHYLMNPRKRRILLKLLAYRFFRGNRFEGKFSFETVAEYQRNLLFQQELRKKRRDEIEKQRRTMSKSSSKAILPFSFDIFRKNMSDLLGANITNDVIDEEQPLLAQQNDSKDNNETKNREEDGEIDPETGRMKFSSDMIEEARKMIQRLQMRTEAALNKHQHAARTYNDQQLLSLSGLPQQQVPKKASSSPTVNRHGVHMISQKQQQKNTQQILEKLQLSQDLQRLQPTGSFTTPHASFQQQNNNNNNSATNSTGFKRITTMELIKLTVDEDERKDLEDLFHLWDEAVQLYEVEKFPGDYEKLNIEVENWYAYRGLVSQRLEVVVNYMQEQEQIFSEIGAQSVIEEGVDEDDENNELSGSQRKKTSGYFKNRNSSVDDEDLEAGGNDHDQLLDDDDSYFAKIRKGK